MKSIVTAEEIKKAKIEYFRAWRKKNRDKVKKAQERYWQKKAKEMRQN